MRKHLTTRVVIIVTSCLLLAASAMTEVPTTMSYQGQLLNSSGDPVHDGVHTIRFRIYDAPTKGTTLWDETQDVTSNGGTINVMLGAVVPLDPALFSVADRWLGLTVGTDNEMTPRMKLASSPYAISSHQADSLTSDPYLNESGDILTGDLHFYSTGLNAGAINLGDGSSDLVLKDDGSTKAYIYGSSYGTIFLNDANSTRTATLDATDDSGGLLRLETTTGATMIELDAGSSSDLSVVLPDSAINQDEIFNEPGIASAYVVGILELAGTMQDLVVVTITIPAPGYIVLIGHCFGRCVGELSRNAGFIQIDETVGGDIEFPYFVKFSPSTFDPDHYDVIPVSVSRVYYKSSPGTYYFRMEGKEAGSYVGTDTYTINNQLIATYYPTSYGAVDVAVSAEEAAAFDQAVPESVPSDVIHGSSEEHYKVDLRELELKAKQARIEALEAELALRRAQREAARQERTASE